jgi:hypothetical protein
LSNFRDVDPSARRQVSEVDEGVDEGWEGMGVVILWSLGHGMVDRRRCLDGPCIYDERPDVNPTDSNTTVDNIATVTRLTPSKEDSKNNVMDSNKGSIAGKDVLLRCGSRQQHVKGNESLALL